MGKRQLFDPARALTALRLRRFQEFCSGRHVVKKIAHDKRGALRRANLLAFLFFSALNGVADTGQRVRCFGDAFHSGHGGNARKRLAAESQGGDVVEILHLPDLTCRMSKKRSAHLTCRNAGAVIRDADEGRSAVADLHRDGRRQGVQRVLRQFLDNGGRPLDHLAGGDLVYRCFIKHLNFSDHSYLFTTGSSLHSAGETAYSWPPSASYSGYPDPGSPE